MFVDLELHPEGARVAINVRNVAAVVPDPWNPAVMHVLFPSGPALAVRTPANEKARELLAKLARQNA